MCGMVHLGGNAAGQRIRPRVWVVIAVAAGILLGLPWAVAIAGGASGGHPGGDPGGIRQAALKEISAGVPEGASVQQYADGTTRWDSCDGRVGTEGWDDVTVDYHFASNLSSDTVVAYTAAKMAALHWVEGPRMHTPQGPVLAWTKTIAGGVGAHAQLSLDQNTPGSHTWDLFAGAPPAGQRVSGC